MNAILMDGPGASSAHPATATASTAERPVFADVVAPYLDRLYGYCVRLVANPADAEDLFQETLIRAMRGYDELRDADHAKGWLFAIATNRSRDLARARGREVVTTTLEEAEEASSEDDFSLFDRVAVEDPFPYSDELHLDFLRLFRDEDVRAIVASLGPTFGVPLVLTVVHGFSCKEAAAILKIPLGTCLSRLYRGRKRLERALWDYAVINGLVSTAFEEEP
ncbi:MAG TPA: RNA polymerase sigma factor [Candidatus Limnocylindrales bacterium]|jgi:RNA polymerase sigma-70 factor (ECF subfamily)|nr:RNA polymerase sigma factor [Candidatus Limnocylindrales bacterium]